MTIEKKAEEVTKNILCKGCENHCSIFLCKSAKSFYAGALAGIEAGRKEREDEIKQVEKSREEIQKNWHDCFLSCSSPYCAAHFPAVEMQGELGNMSKREPEAGK